MTAVDRITAAELHAAGRLDEAESAYRQLVAEQPGDPALHTALADVLVDAGRAAEAAPIYRLVIDAAPTAPTSADAYDGLAAILQDAGDIPNAAAASLHGAQLRGDADEAYRLGYTLDQLGRPADAAAAYAIAADARPLFAEAHGKVGTYLLRQGDVKGAVERFGKATDADPTIAELQCNLAHTLRLSGDEDGALRAVRKAIDLKPDLAIAHNVLGSILRDRLRPANALASFRKAVELDPNYAEAVNNWASVLESIGRVAEAGPGFERAVALAPAVPLFHQNLGMNRLLRGDLTGGWSEIDWRRLDRRNPAGRSFEQPVWNGTPLAGQTVLLTAEQGLGDTIQFLRYAPMVASRGARVVVECQPPLVELARTVPGVADVVPLGQPLPPFHFHSPLMTLPMAFNTTLESIPATVPYLSVDPARAVTWGEKLPTGPRRVGVVWAGNPRFANDRIRSLAPSRLAPLLAVPNVTWVSLQKSSSTTVTPPPGLLDLTADLHDFADTAALISQLDLVIAVDTAVAHLAAALGKPTWILLAAVPDWRWMLGRADSPWYPSVRLFRQTTPGDWSTVVGEVASAMAT
jgi:Flp pilus assembly protein TadD